MQSQTRSPQQGRLTARVGTTLLELIAASTVMVTALVPALQLMCESLRASRRLEVRECLVTSAMGSVELEAQLMARAWSGRRVTLSEPGAASGYPSVLIDVESSDNAASGGSPDLLAVIRATAWEDRNGNGVLDSGESSVTFATKVARLASYLYEGQGS